VTWAMVVMFLLMIKEDLYLELHFHPLSRDMPRHLFTVYSKIDVPLLCDIYMVVLCVFCGQ